MPLYVTDAILGPSRVTDSDLDDLISNLDRPDAKDKTFVHALRDDCAKMGVDDAGALAQAGEETGGFTSPRWNNDLNPGGIGIPSNSTVQPFKIKTPEDAAAIMANCLYAMVKHEASAVVPIPAEAQAWFTGVWLPKVQSGAFPKVTTRRDLNIIYQENGDTRATWAQDPAYPATVTAQGNSLMPHLKDQQGGDTPVTPANELGHVPEPPMMKHWTTGIPGQSRNAGRVSDRFAMIIGTFWHTMVGYLNGTDSYFRGGDAQGLTDYGIGGPWDGDGWDGVLIQWIDPHENIVPWANGTVGQVSPPFGEVPAFIRESGSVDPGVNAAARSIELSDAAKPDRARDATRQIETLAFLTAYLHAEECLQTVESAEYYMLHYETGTDHTGCPGAWLKDPKNRQAVKARSLAIMDAYQRNKVLDPPLLVTYPPGWSGGVIPQPGPKAPQYVTPLVYSWLIEDDHLEHTVEDVRILPLTLEYTAIQDTPRYQQGDKAGGRIGPNITKGTKFKANRVFRSKKGIAFAMTPHGSRVLCSALSPRVQITKSGRISVHHNPAVAVADAHSVAVV
jgi:hypothetical protein